MTLVLARAETSGPRIRLYCEMLPSLLIGAPSKNHKGRRRIDPPDHSHRVLEFSVDPFGFARIAGRRTGAKISTNKKAVGTVRNTRKWPEPKFRPSLNREASRLGDVRVRRPSFRAQVPETYAGIRADRN